MATKEVKFQGAICNSLNEGRNFLLARGFKEMKPKMGGFHHLKELVHYVRPSIVHGIIEEARLIPLTFGRGVMAVIFVGEEQVVTHSDNTTSPVVPTSTEEESASEKPEEIRKR